VKSALQGCYFTDNSELKCRVCVELHLFSKEFYVTCIKYLMQRWKKFAGSEGEYGKIISTF